MTKLVLVLAVVVVVILVVVIVAVRNMRAEDPDEFADQFDGPGRTQGGRDPRYGSGRRPARGGQAARAAARSSRRQGADAYRPAGGGRGFDDPDDQRSEKRRRGDTGPQRADEGRAPARPRRRSGDSSQWDSSEWDKLSDVDYWAELASDKPLTTTAQPAAQPAAEPGSTGPARSRPDLERETPAAPGSRSGFAAAPTPGNGAAGRPRAGADLDDDRRRGGQRQRQPASPDGDRARPDRARAAAARNGDRSRPDRSRLADPSRTEHAPRFLDGGDRGGYLSAGPASLPLPVIRDVPPARTDRSRDIPAQPERPREVLPRRDPRRDAPAARQDRPRAVYDDDPLTSPSFPKVPAEDGRSYRSGRNAGPQRNARADTPPGDSRARAPYLEPTQQFASYGGPDGNYDASARSYDAPPGSYPAPAARYDDSSRQYGAPQHPAPYAGGQHQAPPRPAAADHLADRPAARHSAPRHLANGSGDASRATSHAHRPDSLTSQNPYPYPYESRGSSGVAPAAPAGASNPYGSYVTPEQTVASGYDRYPGTPGNGHEGSYQPAVPSGNGHNGNGYWQQSPAPDGSPDPRYGPYPGSAAQAGDPRGAAAPEPGYLTGYGQPDQAGYFGNGSDAQAPDPAAYPSPDRYGSDGYDGYPEYGAAGH
jgi:hypothetical protein